jgi:OOP family OmpA-OmpF porin
MSVLSVVRTTSLVALSSGGGAALAASTPDGAPPSAPPATAEPGREVGVAPLRSASRDGATGLDTVLSADPGPTGTFRLRLSFFGFSADDFPDRNGDSSFSGTTLALAYTPIEYVETWLSLRNTSNGNDGTHPTLLQTQGDLTLGVKGGTYVLPSLALGLAVSGHFLGGLGGGPAGDGTSVWIRALMTADAARIDALPLRFSMDVGYYFENGEAVVDGQSTALDKIQEFGLQVARYDRVTLGFALDAPLNAYVDPFLEYRIDVPLQVQLTRRADLRDDFDFSAVPHALTPGLRVFPVPELALDALVRIGLASKAYLGVPATPPWMVLFGATYTLDRQPPPPPPAPPPPTAPPPPPEGTLSGRVLTAAGEAVADAVVEYGNAALSAQVVNGAGSFTSYRLPPGKVKLRIRAPKMLVKDVEGTIEAGKATPLEIRLEPDPAQLVGVVRVQVVDLTGKPVPDAEIVVATEPEVTGRTSEEGIFRAEAKPGTWSVTARAPGFKPRTLDGEFKGGDPGTLRIALEKGGATAGGRKTPTVRNVVIRARVLELKRKVHFADGKARIMPDSEPLLEEVAAVLAAHPEIKKIRIEGHTDDRGDRALNLRLSEDRAKSVQSFLVSRGVAGSRLTAKGYGPDKPVAPNLTERGRDKNRRVEFVIVEQDK